ELLLGLAHPHPLGARDVALPVSLDEVDDGITRARHLDERVGEPLFLGVQHLFGLLPALHDEGTVALYPVAAGPARRAIRVLHAIGEFPVGGLGVLFQQGLGGGLTPRVRSGGAAPPPRRPSPPLPTHPP